MKLMQSIQYLFFGILSLLVIGAIIFGALIKNSLPKDNGELSTSKISEEVLIYKDSWGIPHIKAQNSMMPYLRMDTPLQKTDYFKWIYSAGFLKVSYPNF